MASMLGLEEAKKQLRRNPKDPLLNLNVGACYLDSGNFKEALRFFQISATVSPRIIPDVVISFEKYLCRDIKNVQARLALVDFYLSQNDIDSAILELEDLVEIAPETARVYNMLGRIYLKLGRIDGAISLLEKAMEAGKFDESLMDSLAGAYIEKERYADAILLYEKLILSGPSAKRFLRTLIELYMRMSNYESAALKCAQMLTDDPEVVSEATEKLEEIARLTPNSPVVHEQLSQVYARSLKPAKAVIELSRVIKLDPKKTEDVTAALRHILQTYPDNIDAMFLLAQCLTKTGGYSEAVELFNSLAQMDPSLSEKCIEGYKKIISVYPEQSLAHKSLGDSYFEKGSMKEAMSEYMAVLRLDPSESSNIEKKCRDILKSNPGMMDACLVMAESFLGAGDNRKAITLVEELLQKDKDNFDAYRILGDAYFNIDVLNRSKEALRSALRLSPYDLVLQKKYQTICEKELDKEISLLRNKIQQDPWRIGLNLDLARLLYKRGSLEAAVRSLQSALRDSTRAVPSHRLMGVIFKEQGRFDLAKAQFEKMLEYKSDDPEAERIAMSQIGSCLEAFGRTSEAVSLYEKVLSEDMEFEGLTFRVKYLNNTNPSSVRNKSLAAVLGTSVKAIWGRDGRRHRTTDDDLTMLSFGEGQNNSGFEKFLAERLKEAEDDFVLAGQLDSQLLCSTNNLGVSYLRNSENEKALSCFSGLLIEDSGNPVFLNNLAVAYAAKNDLENAEKKLQAALKADKDLNAANYNYAYILLAKGDIKSAVQYFKKIGQNDPLYEMVQRKFYYWDF